MAIKHGVKSSPRKRELYSNRLGDAPTLAATFELVFDGVRWRTKSRNGTYFAAKSIHIFVVRKGNLIVSPRRVIPGTGNAIRHIDLVQGKSVEFAGEIKFGGRSSQRGLLKSWNDKTGHYHDPLRPMNPKVVPLLPQERFTPFGD